MIARIACCWLAWMLAPSAHAQLRDPTAPPAALRQPAQAGGDAVAAAQTDAPRLQSVLISPRRRVAVIDGETVRVGQRHRGAVVTSITPTRVVLARGKTQQILRLYPVAPTGDGQK